MPNPRVTPTNLSPDDAHWRAAWWKDRVKLAWDSDEPNPEGMIEVAGYFRLKAEEGWTLADWELVPEGHPSITRSDEAGRVRANTLDRLRAAARERGRVHA
jgi:hypothetical protein